MKAGAGRMRGGQPRPTDNMGEQVVSKDEVCGLYESRFLVEKPSNTLETHK
jgi:hypothetical protein